jgi:hypothetical protein
MESYQEVPAGFTKRSKLRFFFPLVISIITLGKLQDVLTGNAIGPHHGKIELALFIVASVSSWFAFALETKQPVKK